MILYGIIRVCDGVINRCKKVCIDITKDPHTIKLWETDKNILIDALIQKAVRGDDAFNEVLEFSKDPAFNPSHDLVYYNGLCHGEINWEGPNRAWCQSEEWYGGFGLSQEDATQMFILSSPAIEGDW